MFREGDVALSLAEGRPAMDFFEHQEDARKKTSLLVVYFALAVAAIIAAVYIAVAAFLLFSEKGRPGGPNFSLLWNGG